MESVQQTLLERVRQALKSEIRSLNRAVRQWPKRRSVIRRGHRGYSTSIGHSVNVNGTGLFWYSMKRRRGTFLHAKRVLGGGGRKENRA